jgi:hypothetical protein
MASEFLSISMLQLAIATAICVFSVILKTLCYREASPLRSLPGPRSSHILWGNEKELFFSAPGFIYRHWKKQHGSIFKFSGAFGVRMCCFNISLSSKIAIAPVFVHMRPGVHPAYIRPGKIPLFSKAGRCQNVVSYCRRTGSSLCRGSRRAPCPAEVDIA